MTWSEIINAVPDWLSALGTVGAVILSLYYSGQERRERRKIDQLEVQLLARQIHGDVVLSMMTLRKLHNQALHKDVARWSSDPIEFAERCQDIDRHALTRVRQYLPELWKLGVEMGSALADALSALDAGFRPIAVASKDHQGGKVLEDRIVQACSISTVVVGFLEPVVPALHALAGHKPVGGLIGGRKNS